jgi:hypothetical protein
MWWLVVLLVVSTVVTFAFKEATHLNPDDEIELDVEESDAYVTVYLKGVERPSVYASRPHGTVWLGGPFPNLRILLAAAAIRRRVDRRERLERRARALKERHR